MEERGKGGSGVNEEERGSQYCGWWEKEEGRNY